MKPKLVLIMIIYMVLLQTTVHAFTTTTNDFSVQTSVVPDKVREHGRSPKYSSVQENSSWWDAVGSFFGSIVDAFGLIFNFFTFHVAVEKVEGFPSWLNWLALFLVMPVYIAIIYWVAPYCIKAIQAIGNLIPFT